MGKHDKGIVKLASEHVFDLFRDHPLHEVLHDALLSPLADKDLIEQAELFRLEQERRTGKQVFDVEWTRQCIAYVEGHGYRTRYAQLEYDSGREANLMRLYKLLRKQEAELAEQKAGEEKVAKGAGKTVESVFYFLTKMTVQVMVLVVIFIAVYSMRLKPRRPEVSGGHGSNVFVFDASVSLQQYQESMGALALDGPLMQKAMIDQLYFSRILLNERARALRLTYDVFIYGLACALAVFAFVLVRQ
jgi:hypothetical protein